MSKTGKEETTYTYYPALCVIPEHASLPLLFISLSLHFEICSYTTSSGFSISLMVFGDAVIEVHID